MVSLGLQVKNRGTLVGSLEGMVAGEIIEEYKCSACNKKVQCERKVALKRLPNTLIVHLQRFDIDFETFRSVKINQRLEFPEQLNLKQFMLE